MPYSSNYDTLRQDSNWQALARSNNPGDRGYASGLIRSAGQADTINSQGAYAEGRAAGLSAGGFVPAAIDRYGGMLGNRYGNSGGNYDNYSFNGSNYSSRNSYQESLLNRIGTNGRAGYLGDLGKTQQNIAGWLGIAGYGAQIIGGIGAIFGWGTNPTPGETAWTNTSPIGADRSRNYAFGGQSGRYNVYADPNRGYAQYPAYQPSQAELNNIIQGTTAEFLRQTGWQGNARAGGSAPTQVQAQPFFRSLTITAGSADADRVLEAVNDFNKTAGEGAARLDIDPKGNPGIVFANKGLESQFFFSSKNKDIAGFIQKEGEEKVRSKGTTANTKGNLIAIDADKYKELKKLLAEDTNLKDSAEAQTLLELLKQRGAENITADGNLDINEVESLTEEAKKVLDPTLDKVSFNKLIDALNAIGIKNDLPAKRT